MYIRTAQIFDEVIKATGTTWYTSARSNDLLGGGDAFALQAVTSGVSGSSPTLTVYLEESLDTEHWVRESSAIIAAQSISNGTTYGRSRPGLDPVLAPFLRFAISLGGSSPSCRLELYVTARAYHLAGGGRAASRSMGQVIR